MKSPIVGVLVAIAVTTAMDANGLSAFSALPLLPLMILFAYREQFSMRRLGFSWGQWRHYGLAALYPAVVLSLVTLISACAGAIDISQTDWRKAGINCALIGISTILSLFSL